MTTATEFPFRMEDRCATCGRNFGGHWGPGYATEDTWCDRPTQDGFGNWSPVSERRFVLAKFDYGQDDSSLMFSLIEPYEVPLGR